jgi:3'-phosphoadenosine 5'-phosphosulfate (PAPS) 3'-phosphatase
MDQQKMMNVFRLLCLEAGDIIMKIYESNNFGIDLKSDNSPVTLADRAADEHISNGIRNEFGHIQLITEEQTLTHCKASDSFIIVDPLDGTKSHRNNDTNNYISQYKVSKLKGAGSSLKFCLLAAGEADIYPRLGRTMEWDTAAGHAVLRNAGGHVVKFGDHQPLIYGKPSYENPFFIAYIPGVKLKGSK